MKDYDLAVYGERIADVYDDWMRAIDPRRRQREAKTAYPAVAHDDPPRS